MPNKDWAREESENIRERQNLIHVLEQELRKELIVDVQEEHLDHEVDRDRARTQFFNEDGEMSESKVELLTLAQKKLYLEFENNSNVVLISLFKSLAVEFYEHIA